MEEADGAIAAAIEVAREMKTVTQKKKKKSKKKLIFKKKKIVATLFSKAVIEKLEGYKPFYICTIHAATERLSNQVTSSAAFCFSRLFFP